MHFINVHNKSNHAQEFEVHGFNNNKNIVIKPGATTVLSAADHQSGAIIALHDGHEGEQAEITKDGFGGNDFIDMSNIVGAGGNMTVQQVGDSHTRKGDPLFMQHLNAAWHKAGAGQKNALKSCVHTNAKNDVVRIDAIKDHPELEKFVRSFADGKTYIGVGAWGGSPGVGSDNKQSSAAHGDKDILVTYSDGDASPAQPPELAHRAQQKVIIPHHTESDTHGGPGIVLANKSAKPCTYFFYDNFWNGNGTAGANFTHPLKSTHVNPGKTIFVSLPANFKGRLQRGTQIPATWVEFQLDASNDHSAHGDISLEQGCDGAATIAATDGSKRINGFVKDVVTGAPAGALGRRGDGVKVLASTMGNWMGGPNRAAVEWLEREVGAGKVYVTGGTGVMDVASRNQVLAVEMY
ncbi:hypothetical protein MMC21_008257 [Puttea exsequens]|nr:hypothetical protein [Puttea exsequens]